MRKPSSLAQQLIASLREFVEAIERGGKFRITTLRRTAKGVTSNISYQSPRPPAKWLEMACGKSGKWHWRVRCRNGEIENSSQVYYSRSNCCRAMRRHSEATGLPVKDW